jgi:molybdenum cofactor cytidylyltransferase
MPNVVAVVLAAGSGRRLGRGPKAHVLLGQTTFLARVVGALHDAGLTAIHVVGSTHDPSIRAASLTLGTRLVLNPEPERGMSSSVHVGLCQALEDDSVEGVLVMPVDLPLVRVTTLRLLAGSVTADGTAMCARPVFGGTSGHPIALSRELALTVVAGDPATPLRDALLGARTVDVACDDPGVLHDIDRPEDLERALPGR